jgi:hypothetical protein
MQPAIRLRPIEDPAAEGSWEGVRTGESGDVQVVRLTLDGASARLQLCDFYELEHSPPSCWGFMLQQRKIGKGRLRLQGAPVTSAAPWSKIVVEGRGTADDGLGIVHVTLVLFEPNGTPSINWKVVLYRTPGGMLQTLKAAIERFPKP